MMTHYIEFTIDRDRISKKDQKTQTGQIMGSLITILHRIIFLEQQENNNSNMAISLPRYSEKHFFLGHVIRLHGTEEALSDIFEPKKMAKLIKENPDLMSWLIDAEYLSVSSVLVVPNEVKAHAIYSRKIVKNNIESLRRRRMRRKGESYEQACQAIATLDRVIPKLPKVYLNSQSTKQLFPMLIQCTLVDTPAAGQFTSYGLSKGQATVPLF